MAQAKPMPRLPPVISTVLPASFMSMWSSPFSSEDQRSLGLRPRDDRVRVSQGTLSSRAQRGTFPLLELQPVSTIDRRATIVGLHAAVLRHLDEVRQHRAAG